MELQVKKERNLNPYLNLTESSQEVENQVIGQEFLWHYYW